MPSSTTTAKTISSQSEKSSEEEERRRRGKVCEEALSIYSPSGDERDIARFLFQELKSRGLEPLIDGAGNVLCELGAGKFSVLLCGHMDTVPGEILVKREGDVLYGRGACDAKGPMLSMLFAFEDIALGIKSGTLANLGKVIFACVTEEERNSVGLKEIIRNGIRADAAIFGEPCGPNKVTIGYRGHVPVRFEILTREAHGSAPWLATNASLVAFSIYEKTRELWPEEKNSEHVSVALTQIHSGNVHNVIPGRATMTLDVRVPIGVSTEDVRTSVRKIASQVSPDDVKVSLEFGECTEPYRARLDSSLLRAVNRSILKSGRKPELVSKSGTGDMNTYALAFGIDAVTYGPGDTKLSHTFEEKVSISEILDCSRILKSSVLEFFSLSYGKKE